jgi:hypothetical protein
VHGTEPSSIDAQESAMHGDTMVKRRTFSMLIAGVAAVATLACSDEPTAAQASDATMRVVNATSSPVTVRVNGDVRVSSLAAYAVSEALPVGTGTNTVQFATIGSTTGLAQTQVTTAAGAHDAVAAVPGSGLPMLAVALPDTGSIVASGRSKLRIMHLAANSPPLAIWRTQPDYQTPIAIVTPYGYLSGATIESTAGAWEVRVFAANGGSWASPLAQLSLTIPSGALRTVVTLDAPGGGVQLKVLE